MFIFKFQMTFIINVLQLGEFHCSLFCELLSALCRCHYTYTCRGCFPLLYWYRLMSNMLVGRRHIYRVLFRPLSKNVFSKTVLLTWNYVSSIIQSHFTPPWRILWHTFMSTFCYF